MARPRLALAVILAALGVAAPIGLAPGPAAPTPAPADPVPAAEQAATIDALRPTRGGRPSVAIVALNEATEVSDLLTTFGVLAAADVADVEIVAERAGPVRLYPALTVAPHATLAAFDARRPQGADYVVVPAMDPPDAPAVVDWIDAQRAKGAIIVSVCNGSRTLAAAGLLDGRRATGHWWSASRLRRAHPTMRWAADRRYVVDRGVATSTGVTASAPAMLALVEAIGGRDRAARIAGELGLAHWDARHRSSAFRLSGEHMKTFVRNLAAFWRYETIGVPLESGVDEIALAFLVDAWGRTARASVRSFGAGGAPVTSRRGLTLTPDAATETAQVDLMLDAPGARAPAAALDRILPAIAARFGRPTADIAALALEYPWRPEQSDGAR